MTYAFVIAAVVAAATACWYWRPASALRKNAGPDDETMTSVPTRAFGDLAAGLLLPVIAVGMLVFVVVFVGAVAFAFVVGPSVPT
jgi:hypothetical protein